MNRDIAARMRRRRKEQRLSQAQLAARSNVSLESLKRFEQTGEISLTSLVKIAFALGCEEDFDALFAQRQFRRSSMNRERSLRVCFGDRAVGALPVTDL